MSSQINITSEIQEFVLKNSLRETPLLTELRLATEKLPNAQMLSAPEAAQFIVFLLKMLQARAVIEVGVFTGYTTLAMALALPENGRVIACDVTEAYLNIGKPFWQAAKVTEKIELKIGPAAETLSALAKDEAGQFDLIFIDADKQGYDRYYEQSLILLRQGGVMILDNMLLSGKVADLSNNNPSAMHLRALNRKLHQDPRIDYCLLPLADGIGLVFKKSQTT